MRAAFNALYILAAMLLLSNLACTPHDDIVSTVSAESSGYKLADQRVKCQAAVTTSGMETGGERFDLVSVSLTSLSQPEHEAPCLIVDFERPAGQPTGPYQLKYIFYLKGDNDPPVFYENVHATLTETGRGLFSGTFSATSPKEGAITEGSFANARVIKDYPW